MGLRIGRRKFLIVLIGAAITVVGSFTRVLQVVAFSSAAGIRRLFEAEAAPSGSFVASSVHRAEPARPTAIQNGKGMISYHPSYDHYDRERVTRALHEAVAVGATYVRSDINWRDIMPSPDEVNSSALEWYASYFSEVREAFGLVPMAILSNPAPSVKGVQVDRRLQLWEKYVSAVVKSLGGNCRHFQLLNEVNNPVFGFFPSEATVPALQKAATIIREKIPDAQLGINFLVDIWPWQNQIQDLLSAASDSIDVVGIDIYPGTWNIGINSENRELFARPQSVRVKLPALRSDQAVAISETGYSTNIPFIRNEVDQLNYFQRLRGSVDELKRLDFVGIYELTDENSDAQPDPEANFGLLDSRLRRKMAFGEVQRLFSELNA